MKKKILHWVRKLNRFIKRHRNSMPRHSLPKWEEQRIQEYKQPLEQGGDIHLLTVTEVLKAENGIIMEDFSCSH